MSREVIPHRCFFVCRSLPLRLLFVAASFTFFFATSFAVRCLSLLFVCRSLRLVCRSLQFLAFVCRSFAVGCLSLLFVCRSLPLVAFRLPFVAVPCFCLPFVAVRLLGCQSRAGPDRSRPRVVTTGPDRYRPELTRN